MVLLAFFVSSTALSHAGRHTERKRRLQQIGKTGARDGTQVLANGGIAAICALASTSGDPIWHVSFAAALAVATADTWGTEIGALQTRSPRSILTGKPIAAGLSGAVSALGTAAELGGAIFISAVAWAANVTPALLAVTAGGFVGALLDSVLGASVQALRFCRGCETYCEADPHHCGADTTLVRGAPWMTNDAVNFLATAGGAAVAAAIYIVH